MKKTPFGKGKKMSGQERPEEPKDKEMMDVFERASGVILDAANRCRNCNFCFSICPLFHSTRGFHSQTPSGLLQAIHYALKWDLIKGPEKNQLRDLLYLCTTCNGCVLRCKSKATGLPILQAIEAGRRVLVDMMIGPLPAQRKPLKNLNLYGNPYGERPEKRLDWSRGMPVKRLPREKAPILFYVGCTVAYDPALQRLGRILTSLLNKLKVDFGVLENEVCCGDPALRMGDEALFQELRNQNMDRFREANVRTMVTVSPHCFNAFFSEYPALREKMEILHYTEFLWRRLKEKGKALAKTQPQRVTYHDPCYLGKRNQRYDPPRQLLRMVAGIELVEMKMNREEALCCGGGGGRMYAEVEEVVKLSHLRLRQALDSRANVLATACPWCCTMLQNAANDLLVGDQIKVKDISEILEESIQQ
jgi:Fe-S oxidoreductase